MNAMLDCARAYASLNWRVFPCQEANKYPAVGPLKADDTAWRRECDPIESRVTLGGFHRATTEPAQLAAWWGSQPRWNVAVRLGGGLGMLEVDNEAAAAFVDEHCTVITPTIEARRGLNRIVAVPLDIVQRPSTFLFPGRFGHGIELKTGLGYALLPPSLHPTGHRYVWADGRSPFDCAIAPLPDVFATEARRVDAEREAPALSVTPVGSHRSHPSPSWWTWNERKAHVARLAAYLDKVDVGLADGRKSTAYRLAAALYTRLACSQAETAAIVGDWNATNLPPLEDHVLEVIIENAFIYGPRKAA